MLYSPVLPVIASRLSAMTGLQKRQVRAQVLHFFLVRQIGPVLDCGQSECLKMCFRNVRT